MKTKLAKIKITLINWRLAFTLALVFSVRGPENKRPDGGTVISW